MRQCPRLPDTHNYNLIISAINLSVLFLTSITAVSPPHARLLFILAIYVGFKTLCYSNVLYEKYIGL